MGGKLFMGLWSISQTTHQILKRSYICRKWNVHVFLMMTPLPACVVAVVILVCIFLWFHAKDLFPMSYLSSNFPTSSVETLTSFVHHQIGREEHNTDTWESLKPHCTNLRKWMTEKCAPQKGLPNSMGVLNDFQPFSLSYTCEVNRYINI